MGTIHLVVHAEATASGGLTPIGRRQAVALGSSWESVEWAPASVVAGSLPVHDQTAIEVVDVCGGDGHDVHRGWDGGDDAATLEAFAEVVRSAQGDSSVAVFASAGPVALVASHLLVQHDGLAARIAEVLVHVGVTTVLTGAEGPRLLTLNELTHLPRELIGTA